MDSTIHCDWDPRSKEALADPIKTSDEMRRRCPVAHSDFLGWSLFRHGDVRRVLCDHETFSSVVSSYTSVPNGMDPPEHTHYRAMLEPYFSPEVVDRFEADCRAIAGGLLDGLMNRTEVEVMGALGHPFALDVQCAFTGWDKELRDALRDWVVKNHRATLAADRPEMKRVAAEFQGYVKQHLDERREGGDDAIARLMRERVNGELLTLAEITSILRNWTVGEIGTIAASIGILIYHLIEIPSLQETLRKDQSLVPAAIEEVLRKEAPLLSNRRRTTREVEVGGQCLPTDARITVMWAAANRDESVFEEPDEIRIDRDQKHNLLWGAGVHQCPGLHLARMELRVFLEELFARTKRLDWGDSDPLRAVYPTAGFSSLEVRPTWI